jgi:eukaryotic-like serine/threonine-protein kinase
MFRREAVGAARLTHSNIVSVFDTGEHDGAPFIVMEYLGGGSVRDRLNSGPLEPQEVARLGADACAALAHAHKVGIIHGNMRPENVLYTEGGHLKVSDFAIAKATLANPRLTDPDGTFSSSAYSAPELAKGGQPDERSDLYALGVILYEALTGMTPIEAARAAQAAAPEGERVPTPAPSDLRPGVPEDLDLAIIGCLQKNPEGRFQNARALERTLRPLAGGPVVPAPSAAPAPPRAAVARQRRSDAGATRLTEPPPPARPAPAAPPPEFAEERRVPAHRAKGDSFLRTEGRWLLPTVLVIAAAAALVFSIPSLRTGIGNVVAPLQPGEQAEPLRISRALAYDPPPGDGEETSRRLGQAVDGNPETSWATSSYSRAEFGGLKDGVGIYFDLGSARELSGIKVSSVAGGWKGAVRYSEDGRSWSDPGPSITASADHTFETSGSHRYWMIWITELVITPGEGTSANRYTVAIREIEPLAAG